MIDANISLGGMNEAITSYKAVILSDRAELISQINCIIL